MYSTQHSASTTVQGGQAMQPLTMPSLHHSRSSVLPPEVLEAARRQWRLFPMRPNDSFAGPTANIQEATSDLDQLERWVIEQPGLRWAVACGEVSGMFVLEVDAEQGRNGLCTLCDDDWDWCQTLQSKSGNTGYLYLRWPEGFTLCNAVIRLASGLRIRANGDYVNLPQSTSSAGQPHFWSSSDDDIAPCPQWLFDYAFAPAKARASAKLLVFPDRTT